MRNSLSTLLLVTLGSLGTPGCQSMQTASVDQAPLSTPVQTVSQEEKSAELQPIGYEEKSQRTTLTNLFRREKLQAIPLPRTDLNEELQPVEHSFSMDFNDF